MDELSTFAAMETENEIGKVDAAQAGDALLGYSAHEVPKELLKTPDGFDGRYDEFEDAQIPDEVAKSNPTVKNQFLRLILIFAGICLLAFVSFLLFCRLQGLETEKPEITFNGSIHGLVHDLRQQLEKLTLGTFNLQISDLQPSMDHIYQSTSAKIREIVNAFDSYTQAAKQGIYKSFVPHGIDAPKVRSQATRLIKAIDDGNVGQVIELSRQIGTVYADNSQEEHFFFSLGTSPFGSTISAGKLKYLPGSVSSLDVRPPVMRGESVIIEDIPAGLGGKIIFASLPNEIYEAVSDSDEKTMPMGDGFAKVRRINSLIGNSDLWSKPSEGCKKFAAIRHLVKPDSSYALLLPPQFTCFDRSVTKVQGYYAQLAGYKSNVNRSYIMVPHHLADINFDVFGSPSDSSSGVLAFLRDDVVQYEKASKDSPQNYETYQNQDFY